MAVTTTTRLGITRWSSPADAFNRTQLDDSHAALEAKAAMFLDGAIADRPAAGSSNTKAFYHATDTQILYFSTGSTWVQVGSFGTPVALIPNNSTSAGVAVTAARSDHVHGMNPYGGAGQVAQVGTTTSAGVLDAFTRIDHAHILANGAVTPGKIASGGVSASNQIANGIIVAAHFAPGAIGEGAIAADQRIPTGGMMSFGGTIAPTGWVLCDGASYSTSSYASLFNAIGYRYGGAGASFNVPNFIDRIPRGGTNPGVSGTLGLTAGADTATLVSGNIPSHTHAIDHDHAAFSAVAVGDHQHTIAHDHGTGSTTVNGGHAHAPGGGWQQFIVQNIGGANALDINAGTGATVTSVTTTALAGDHNHLCTVPALGAVGSSFSGNHTHTIDVPSFSGTSGAFGSGTGFSILPKTLTVNFIIKI